MGLMLAVAGGCSGARAADITYACRIDTPKAAEGLPGLCDSFAARLRVAYPDRRFTPADPATSARIVLVVQRAGSHAIEAAVEVGGVSGPAQGAARRGAPLEASAIERLLDRLIATAPTP